MMRTEDFMKMSPAQAAMKAADISYENEQLCARIAELEQLAKEMAEALEKADGFITNGVALGFIRMPDAGCPDPAHETPPAIKQALSRYREVCGGK